MANPEPVQYIRLPGGGTSRKGGSFFAVTRTGCRLWLGDDHLLQVESAGGYSESYKRFYFSDIQVIYLHKTRSWFVVNIVLSLLMSLFLLWALVVKDPGGRIALEIIATSFGICLLLNLAGGSTCMCQIKTAVSLEELPSLRRRRNAEKVLGRLKPLIEASQGRTSAETFAPLYSTLLANANVSSAVPGQFARVAGPAVDAYRSRAHQVLFSALLADAMTRVIYIFLPSVPAVMLGIIIGAVVAIATLVALVKQHQTDLKRSVRVLTWVTAGFVGLNYLTGYANMFVVAPRLHNDGTQWGFVKAFAETRPLETPWLLAVLSIFATMAGLLGGIGLLWLRRTKRETDSVA